MKKIKTSKLIDLLASGHYEEWIGSSSYNTVAYKVLKDGTTVDLPGLHYSVEYASNSLKDCDHLESELDLELLSESVKNSDRIVLPDYMGCTEVGYTLFIKSSNRYWIRIYVDLQV